MSLHATSVATSKIEPRWDDTPWPWPPSWRWRRSSPAEPPCTVPPGPNVTTGYDGRWLAAKATWYGNPAGAGPDDNGGACGIKDVDRPPYSGMTSCGNGGTAPSSTTARAAAHATRYYVR